MKKPRQNLIPLTKNAPSPAPAAPTIGQLQNEAIQRLRRINADQSRVGEIIDILVAEIIERDTRLKAGSEKTT